MHFYLIALLIVLLAVPVALGQAKPRTSLLQDLIDLPAPAPADPSSRQEKNRERPHDFQDDDKIPPDDAPIEDLLDYWSRDNDAMYTAQFIPTPSAKTVERLMKYCEEHPEVMPNYVAIFPPDLADSIREIHASVKDRPHLGYASYRVEQWLKYHDKEKIDELAAEASQIRDEGDYTSTQNQYALRALARLDWERALPIIRRLENDAANPASAVLAKWMIYRRAMDEGDSMAADSYREQIMKVVADKNASFKIRDLAMDALTHSPAWPGRDEWYVSLLEDETLLAIGDRGWTGLTTLLMESPRKEWIPQMIELTASKNIVVRSAAVRNLLRVMRPDDTELLKALVPWLTNPDWIKRSEREGRGRYINTLSRAVVPEAVPGLIWLVQHDADLRTDAVAALGNQKDPRAIPVLKMILARDEFPAERQYLIRAVFSSGGFSDEEQMAALDSFVAFISRSSGAKLVANFGDYYIGEGSFIGEAAAQEGKVPVLPLQTAIGMVIAEEKEPSAGLVARAVERLKVLKRTDPPAGAQLAEIMLTWEGPAIFTFNLRNLASGESDLNSIIAILANRKAMQEKIPLDLANLRRTRGVPRGIGSCTAEDPVEYAAILEQDDAAAKIALMGCARLIRASVPIETVGALLQSPDKMLALAAERYLESEDSLAARRLVLAMNKGKSIILGARSSFIPEASPNYDGGLLTVLFRTVEGGELSSVERFPILHSKEETLRKEMGDTPSLQNVFAMLTNEPAGHHVIRLYKDRAVFTYYENEGRYRERDLTEKEYKAFRDLLIADNIDGQKPSLRMCHNCIAGEFILFDRNGGRRVFFEDTLERPELSRLKNIFSILQSGGGRLHYHLAGKIPGLEILIADDKLPVRSVWKKGDDLRFVVHDTELEKELQQEYREKFKEAESARAKGGDEGELMMRELNAEYIAKRFAHLSWRRFENGKPVGLAAQPAEAEFLYDRTPVDPIPESESPSRAWQVRSGKSEIHAGGFGNPGLFRLEPGKATIKIGEGWYNRPIVSGDGKWAVVSKIDRDEEETFRGLVRVNLRTGVEYRLSMPPANHMLPIALVPSINKVLVYSGPTISGSQEAENPAARTPLGAAATHYVVDAATGLVQPVKGEFRPLEDQTYRPLQPTSVPGEYWAAIYDAKTKSTSIGRYSDKAFSFKPILNLPSINLDSMAIWVDEAAGKVYFVYEGHLLSVPLK